MLNYPLHTTKSSGEKLRQVLETGVSSSGPSLLGGSGGKVLNVLFITSDEIDDDGYWPAVVKDWDAHNEVWVSYGACKILKFTDSDLEEDTPYLCQRSGIHEGVQVYLYTIPCCGPRASTADIFTINFTDEDSFYAPIDTGGNCSLYETDKSDYHDLLDTNSDIEIQGLMALPVLNASDEYIYPAYGTPLDSVRCPAGTGLMPDGITAHVIHRDGALTLAEMIDVFNESRAGTKPNFIALIVDNSGSMSTGNIQPMYTQFVAWLQDEYEIEIDKPVTVIERTTTERWVYHLRNAVIELIALYEAE